MIGGKLLLVTVFISLCWTLVPANEDNEKLNDIDGLEEATLSYDFEEKFDKMEKNIEFLMSAFTKTKEELQHIRQAIDQSPNSASIAVGQNGFAKLNVLEVKCPEDRLPDSCYEVNECKTDIYSIMIPSYSNQSLAVSCDLKTENGGWTVIQRRQDGSVNFYRNWTEYVKGFGDVNGEFFIGLEKLHHLTAQENQPQELYILLEDFEGEQRYAKYQIFKIDSKDTDYKLTVGNYSGNAGDCLTPHNGQKFSTWDHDNDGFIDSNCAEAFTGAWWYKKCYHSNLNGIYLMGKLSESKSGQGTSWNSFRGYDYSLKFVQMMIRPRQN